MTVLGVLAWGTFAGRIIVSLLVLLGLIDEDGKLYFILGICLFYGAIYLLFFGCALLCLLLLLG